MTAPGALPEVLDGAAVGIFGILLSAAFCPIRWTDKNAGRWRAVPPGCWRCRGCSTLVPAPRLPSTFTPSSPTCRCMSCWCCSAGRRSGRWWQCSRPTCAVRCGAGRRWRWRFSSRSIRWCSRWQSCCSPCRCCCCSSGSLRPPCGSFPTTRPRCSASSVSCRWWATF